MPAKCQGPLTWRGSVDASLRKKGSTLGSYSFEYVLPVNTSPSSFGSVLFGFVLNASLVLFLNGRITSRLEYSHSSLGFEDVTSSRRKSEDTVDTGALDPYLDFQEENLNCYCLKREETSFSHGMVSKQDLSAEHLSAFLRLCCMINLLLGTPGLVGHKHLLQVASRGRGHYTHSSVYPGDEEESAGLPALRLCDGRARHTGFRHQPRLRIPNQALFYIWTLKKKGDLDFLTLI